MSDNNEIARAIGDAIIQAARYANRDANEYSKSAIKTTKILGNQIRQNSIPGFMLQDGSIPMAKIRELSAEVARIALAEIAVADIEFAQIKNVVIDNAHIGTAGIDYAHIKDLDTESAYFGSQIFELGLGEELYLGRLRVNAANIAHLEVGELILEDAEGDLYKIGVDELGNVVTTLYEVGYQNIASTTKTLMSQYTVYRGAEAPSTPYVDQLWVKTDTDIIYRCIAVLPSVVWEPVKANELHTSYINAVEKGLEILSTGVIDIKSGGSINIKNGGDINVDSMGNINIEAGGKLNLSSATDLIISTGTTIGDYIGIITGNKNTIFYQASIPTSLAEGDLWYDIDATPIKIYRASISGADQIAAGEWADVTTVALSQALSAAQDAQDTADDKALVFIQNNAPSTGMQAGDIWVDSDGSSLVYVYNGSAWVALASGGAVTSAIILNNSGISVLSDGKISLQSGSDLDVLSGADINVKSGGKINIAATDLNISGQTISAYADDKITLAVGGIQVGGTNILSNSSNVLSNISVSTYTGLIQAISLSSKNLVPGDTITARVYFKPAGTKSLRVTIWFYDGGGEISGTRIYGNIVDKASEGYSEATGVIPAGATAFNFYAGVSPSVSGTTTEQIKEAKLEKGNKATDWSPSPSDPAVGVKTSGIEIGPDYVDVQTDAFEIKNSRGESMLSVSSASGGDPGGQLVVGSDTMPIRIGGNFVLPVENGGTGNTGSNRIHFISAPPGSSLGNNGDLAVMSGASSGGYTAISPTWESSNTGLKTLRGVYRNWNSAPVSGYIRAGNANTESASYYYGASWYFTAPAGMSTSTALTLNFVSVKYHSSTWYGWNVSVPITIALYKFTSGDDGTFLGSTTFVPTVNATSMSVSVPVASGALTGAILIQIFDPNDTPNKSVCLIKSLSIPAVSGGAQFQLYVKHDGTWYIPYL